MSTVKKTASRVRNPNPLEELKQLTKSGPRGEPGSDARLLDKVTRILKEAGMSEKDANKVVRWAAAYRILQIEQILCPLGEQVKSTRRRRRSWPESTEDDLYRKVVACLPKNKSFNDAVAQVVPDVTGKANELERLRQRLHEMRREMKAIQEKFPLLAD